MSRFFKAAPIVLLLAAGALAAPVPNVQIASAPPTVLINTTMTFQVTFQNTGTAPGFGPFVDLVLPAGGADFSQSGCTCDGLSFVSAAITSINPPAAPLPVLPPQPNACPGPPSVPHPLADSGLPSPVAIGAGGQLVTLRLPFGDFEPTQPPVTITVTLKVSEFADVDVPLKIFARGGFEFGADALKNPGTDPPIVTTAAFPPDTTWASVKVTPKVATLKKIYLGPENETTPASNFPRQYLLQVDVAPGQTITNVTIVDCLPSSLTLVSVDGVPATGPCASVKFPSLSGVNAVTLGFYANNKPAVGPPKCFRPVQNTASLKATWQPRDPCDPGPVTVSASARHTLFVRAIAAQKTAVPPRGGIKPGSTILYTINFQVSDYLRFGEIVIDDTLSDGVTPGVPVLTVSDRFGSIVNRPFQPNEYSFGPGAFTGNTGCAPFGRAGARLLRMNVSKAMADATSAFPGATLTGGLAISPPLAKGATGTITYSGTVDDKYTFPPHFAGIAPDIAPDDGFVGKDDPIENRVVIRARLYTLASPPAGTAGNCSNDSVICAACQSDLLAKEIVARNGQPLPPPPTPGAPPQFAANDTITFRIAKTIPSGDAQDILIDDWVPLPVLRFPSAGPTVVPCTAAPPAVGQFCVKSTAPVPLQLPLKLFPPDHVQLHIKPFNDPNNAPNTIEIFFTLSISNDPYADGLFLTNEAEECEYNSYGGPRCQAAIARFELIEPRLRITKGIVASSSSGAVFTPSPPSPVSWKTPPTSTVPRFSGIITAPPTVPIRSDVTADANDVLTFAIVVENDGHGQAFDVVVTDVIPAGLTLVGGVQVTYGDGTPIAGSTINATTVTLGSPLAAAGAANGHNVAVISYDVRVPANVTPGCVSNLAKITHYAASTGGADFVGAGFGGPFTDSAAACVLPVATKCVMTTSEPSTTPPDSGSGIPSVTIGEIVRYRLVMTIPEGTIPAMNVEDLLPAGLTYLNDGTTKFAFIANSSISSAVIGCATTPGSTASCLPALPATACILPVFAIAPAIFTDGVHPIFSFGNVVNSDNDGDPELLVIEFNAVVSNVPSNHASPPTLSNRALVSSGGSVVATSNAVAVNVVEPKLEVTKEGLKNVGINGYRWVIKVKNTGTATAFDVHIAERANPCVFIFSSPIITSDGTAPPVVLNDLLIKLGSMPPGSSVEVDYLAAPAGQGCTCGTWTNTVDVTWNSVPAPNGTTPNATGSTSGALGTPTGGRTYSATATASLCTTFCGIKFFDPNNRGTYDPGADPAQSGLGGFTISVGTESTVTGLDGKYCLQVLALPFYNVCETLPASGGWTATTPLCKFISAQGTPQGALTGITYTVNFGNKTPCSATVSGEKYRDLNADGLPQLSEGLPGWTIFARSGADQLFIATTGNTGLYSLTLPGNQTYTITEVPQNGWNQVKPKTTYAVTVTCGPPDVTTVVDDAGNAVAPNALHFENRLVCSGCPPNTHCDVNSGTCVADPPLSPCAVVRCRPPFECRVINGAAMCVP